MYSSTYTILKIFVFTHFILKYAYCPKNENSALSVPDCLNRIASYFNIKVGEDKIITSTQCVKNAIDYLIYPAVINNVESGYYKELVDNINPDTIQDKFQFCGYRQPSSCLNFNTMSKETKICLKALEEFPDDKESTIKYALMDVRGFDYKTVYYGYIRPIIPKHGKHIEYMNQIYNKVKLKGSVLEPIDYCIQNVNTFNMKVEDQ